MKPRVREVVVIIRLGSSNWIFLTQNSDVTNIICQVLKVALFLTCMIANSE
jgi:hypothetical protein